MKKINPIHLLWIVPLTTFLSLLVGILFSAAVISSFHEDYPIIDCIYNLDDALNIDNNKLPFTKESQREAIQWRCAKETVDFNITDFEEIFVME